MTGKLVVAVVAVLMSIVLFGCQKKMEEVNIETEYAVMEESSIETVIAGDDTEVEIDMYLGESAVYTESQLEEAINLILDSFEADFEQCTLQEIEYDEEYSLSQEEMNKEMFQVDNAVVFKSTFVVDDNYMNGPLNAGQTYEDYEWILNMDADGNWSILTSGY